MLKVWFSTSPNLQNPITQLKFAVEEDASILGVRATTMTLATRKVALEEWRHWLGGIKVPFLVWTDH